MKPGPWLALTVVTLPLLVPRGPGGTAPVDVPVLLLLASVAVLVVMDRRNVPLPGIAALSAFFVVGLVSLAVSPSGSGLLSLAIDAYLVALLCAVACVLRRDESALLRLLAVWSVAALGWAILLLGSHYGLLPARLADLLDANTPSRRAAAAAHNPNLAASYLATSVFVLLASPWPRGLLRLAGVGTLVLAVWASGSNGALLALAVAGAVLWLATLVRRTPPSRRLATWGLALVGTAVGIGLLLPVTGVPQLGTATVDRIAQQNSSGAFSDSLGRLDLSVASREKIWTAAADGLQTSPLVGVGPGRAADIRTGEGGVLGKGLHNDYLAALVERGVLGLLALAWVVVTVLRWCAPLLAGGRRRAATGSWWPAGLAGAVIVNLVVALTHESLHFRHLWLVLALTWVASRLPHQTAPVGAEAAAMPVSA